MCEVPVLMSKTNSPKFEVIVSIIADVKCHVSVEVYRKCKVLGTQMKLERMVLSL